MDFVHPVQALIPGAQGEILAVLSQTTAELNLRTLARLSGVSVAQASRVLPRLVELGLVRRREVPPASLFRFVPDHVASRAVTALAHARRSVLDELASAADQRLAARSVVVFGSFARGEASAASDLDIVVVRPAGVTEDDDRWGAAVEDWRQWVRALSGNNVEVIEVGEDEVPRLLGAGSPLWSDVLDEGILVAGVPLIELTGE